MREWGAASSSAMRTSSSAMRARAPSLLQHEGRRSGSLRALHRRVGGDQVAIIGDMIGEERAEAFDVVAPITVQFAGNSEPGHDLHAGRRMRSQAECRVISLKVPEASVTTKTS